MSKKGFTLIELIIVIAIMGIMLVIGVVNLRASQTVANDKEREADVSNFAIALEDYYKFGSGNTTTFEYPATVQFTNGTSVTSAAVSSILPDLDQNNLLAPGVTDIANTLTLATNNVATTAGVLPQPTINQYVYQPLDKTGALCTLAATNCTKFYLYYKLEADGLVYSKASRNK
jgi:prepilin-type N-terminal cleavage/methylation domain-containing protein